MLSVDVSDLEDDAREDLPEFIESKLMVKSEKDGEMITFDDKNERTHVKSTEIRTYLKRFAHSKNLKKRYRLLSKDGTLKFVKLKPDQIEEDEEGDKK